MARGRSKFGNHNKPTAKMKAAQKKRGREVNALVSNVFAATAAASHEVARQSKKSAKRSGTSRAVSPEYAAAVRLADEERLEALKDVKVSKTDMLLFALAPVAFVLGCAFCVLFLPVGLVLVATGVYLFFGHGKIAAKIDAKREVASEKEGGSL